MVRSATYGHPVRVVREYAPGTLRGTYGEPVRAVRLVRPGARGERGQRITPVTYVPDGVSGLRDAAGSVIEAVSFYSQEGRTADGRVIRPVAYYSSTGLPLIEALFAGGTAGAAYLISPETCFTDTARTTPAQVGQAVAAVTDLSGRGNHPTQATAASRPILRQDSGGYYYLEFDGVGDFLSSASPDFGFTSSFDVWTALRFTGDATYRPILGKYTSAANEGYDFGIQSGTPRMTLRGSSVLDTSFGGFSSIIGANTVLGSANTPTRIRRTVNNDSLDTSGSWVPVVSPQVFAIGARGNSAERFIGRLYSLLMIGRALSDAETVLARRMVAASCGKVL